MRGFLVLAVLCAPVSADDLAKAHEAYHAGSQHYDLGEYREALESFKEAYRIHEDPIFLFNLAQCYRQLGDKAQAVRMYRSFLNKNENAPNRNQVRDMIAKLEKQLADEQAAKTGPPQGMLTPSPEPASEPVSSPAPVPATAPPTMIAPSAKPEPVAAAMAPESAPTEKLAATPVYKKWWLWTAVGVAVAVAAVGVGVGVGVNRSQPAKTPTAMTAFGTFKF
jgi:tetratricopeptide (TPR) repeat protein